jgi:CTD small phosphatase-like protein 2
MYEGKPALESVQLKRPSLLPPQTRSSKKLTLLVDLDETLVHCSIEEMENAEFIKEVHCFGDKFIVRGKMRPHCMEFLKKAAEKFEVVVYTASRREYADQIINLIDPKRMYIKYRLFREACVPILDTFVKELSNIGRDLSKTILVDNSPQVFSYQVSHLFDGG